MAPLFACIQPPRVAAPFDLEGVVGDRRVVISQPSEDAAKALLSDPASLCNVFASLKQEGEYLEVISAAGDRVRFRARRLSTGEEWAEALEAKKVAAEQAAAAHESLVAELAKQVATFQKALEQSALDNAARLEASEERQNRNLEAREAEAKERENVLLEMIEENNLCTNIFASTGQAIALRLLLDQAAGVTKESTFLLWASKQKQVSKGMLQMSRDEKKQKAKKEDPDLEPGSYSAWLAKQTAGVEVDLPKVGKKQLSQQALTTLRQAQHLSQNISGASDSSEGAHSAPLVAIAYVLVHRSTPEKFKVVEPHLEGLKDLFRALFDISLEEVLADYKAGRKCWRVGEAVGACMEQTSTVSTTDGARCQASIYSAP